MTHNNDVVPIPVSVDVLIVGAGLSGIGTACYLTRERPQDDFLILEARAESGGTWDKFRYPGIRSDSDLFTFGYEFRPWSRSNAIAAGGLIRSYIRDTAAEYGIDEHIVYNTKVLAADWDSESARWTITAERAGQTITVTARWFVSASGYYDHDRGHSPSFPGQDDFAGTIVHPQDWPEDLDYADKRVVVIGSGATAVTLVPALAGYSADTGAEASAGWAAACEGWESCSASPAPPPPHPARAMVAATATTPDVILNLFMFLNVSRRSHCASATHRPRSPGVVRPVSRTNHPAEKSRARRPCPSIANSYFRCNDFICSAGTA